MEMQEPFFLYKSWTALWRTHFNVAEINDDNHAVYVIYCGFYKDT